MQATVTVLAPDGREHDLVPGDLVGRLWTAALQIDDGRISEAHALVSLRDGRLQLIALRGAFAVRGKRLEQVVLEPGLEIQLARGLHLQVIELHLPEHVLGLEGPGLPRQTLPGVASILAGPRLVAGWREDALVWCWATGDGVRLEQDGQRRELRAGDELSLGGQTLRAVAIPLQTAGRAATRRQGSLQRPLLIAAHFDTVQIHRAGLPPVPVGGKPARLISELVAVGTSLSWQALAQELWPDEEDLNLLRGRLDVVLSRLRRKLRARGIRSDLVQPDGAGQFKLLLYEQDRVEDHT